MLDLLAAYLKEHWRDFVDSPSAFGEIEWLIQSRSRILAFAFVKDSRQPIAVAKISRDEQTAQRTRNEFENLLAIRDCLTSPWKETIPRPISLEQIGKRTVAWERVLRGHPLPLAPSFSFLGKDKEPFEQVYRWLVKYQSQCCYGVQSLDAQVIESDLIQPLATLLGQFGFAQSVQERMCHLVNQLQGLSVPRVHRHGDLHPTNLLFEGDTLQGVTDWEMAVRDVWPFFDWFQFVFEYHSELARKQYPKSSKSQVLQCAVDSMLGQSRRAEAVRIWTIRFLANYGVSYKFAPILWLHYACEVYWPQDKEEFLAILVPAVVRWAGWDNA